MSAFVVQITVCADHNIKCQRIVFWLEGAADFLSTVATTVFAPSLLG